ncbi:hypothetical protein B0F90DRAFT_1681709 [Multifurca ochricompacta]|uniref:Uncharacterized protein n=1 Tax=Multifurca ochricompacta TaxID=376703 RepID=A0AAD4QUI1_9AGAM|nr:hypothetical protein B0F90DRAFT_1681709 [Multifurca ochricompacta]
MSAETLQTLQIAAITLASLDIFVLFMLAIWTTYQQGTVSSKRLRGFLDLLIHFTTRSLEFSRARLQNDRTRSLLSDGILAWRFYVVFCREKWALYIPATAVVANAFLCWSADVQHLAIYFNRDFYEKTLLPVTLDITVAWGWFIFLNNTVMTGGILYKVIWASRAMQSVHDGGMKVFSLKYDTILHAVIESALVTWIGILIYEIAALAPTGHVTVCSMHFGMKEVLNVAHQTHLGIGFVILDIIPIFFVGDFDFPLFPEFSDSLRVFHSA